MKKLFNKLKANRDYKRIPEAVRMSLIEKACVQVSRGVFFSTVIIIASFLGLFIYTFYTSRAYSYLSDDPATCVNCHIMSPYYATWLHSSHGRNTTCNDCHVPQDNIFSHYFFKAKDGLRHSAVFTMRAEPQAIQAIEASSQVIMNNCIRCHDQLNTEFIKAGRMTFKEMKAENGMACWDCHREVTHTRSRSISSTPNALVPLPESNVPKWLSNMKLMAMVMGI